MEVNERGHCQFCGTKVTELARKAKANMLKHVPAIGIAMVHQDRGVCEDHLKQLLSYVKQRSNGSYGVKRRPLMNLARILWKRYMRQLVRWNGGDGLYFHFRLSKQVYGHRHKRSKVMNIDDFIGVLWVRDTYDKTFKTAGRRGPRKKCYLTPPLGPCVYTQCNHSDKCGGGLMARFAEAATQL